MGDAWACACDFAYFTSVMCVIDGDRDRAYAVLVFCVVVLWVLLSAPRVRCGFKYTGMYIQA
jgi:hypothetical protein